MLSIKDMKSRKLEVKLEQGCAPEITVPKEISVE